MSKFKLLFAVLAALCAMAFATGTASASRTLQIDPGGDITAESLGLLTLVGGTAFGDIVVTCLVTLDGSLVSDPLVKRAGTQIGVLDAGHVADPCNPTDVPIFGSTATSARTLLDATNTWALTYNSFLGQLPTPSGILFTVNDAQFSITLAGIDTCLYRGDVPALLGFSATSPNLSQLIEILRNTIGLESGGPLCPQTGELIGAFSLDPQQELILGD